MPAQASSRALRSEGFAVAPAAKANVLSTRAYAWKGAKAMAANSLDRASDAPDSLFNTYSALQRVTTAAAVIHTLVHIGGKYARPLRTRFPAA